MADIPSIQEINQAYLASVKAANTKINTNFTGTVVDVFSQAYSSITFSLYQYLFTIDQGNNIFTAGEFMLNTYTQELGISQRKTGSVASGDLLITLESGTTTLSIPANSSFRLGNISYSSIEDTVIDKNNNLVKVAADQAGAEYNLKSGASLKSDIKGIETAVSQGIFGGNGLETLAQLRQRILDNIQFRRTSSQLSDYVQFCLEYFNYCVASTVFINDVIPIGVNCLIVNTIQDFDIASINTVINEIECSPKQLAFMLGILNNQKSTDVLPSTSTTTTQVIPSLEITIEKLDGDKTPDAALTEKVKIAVRKSVLLYNRESFFAAGLDLTSLNDIVKSFFITPFAPIDVTSPQLDLLLGDINVIIK